MTNLTPELEAMVEPMAWTLCQFRRSPCECFIQKSRGACEREKGLARLAISLGARIEVPKSPGQRAFEKASAVWRPCAPWNNISSLDREVWEQIAAAAREES